MPSGSTGGVALLLVCSFLTGCVATPPPKTLSRVFGVPGAQRALDLRPIGRGFLITAPNSPSNCLFKTLPTFIPGRAYSFLPPPIRDLSYCGPQTHLKGMGESDTPWSCAASATLVGCCCCWCCCWTIGPWFRPDRHIALHSRTALHPSTTARVQCGVTPLPSASNRFGYSYLTLRCRGLPGSLILGTAGPLL